MQRTANTTSRSSWTAARRALDREQIRESFGRLDAWSRRPMTPRAECAVSAVVGAVCFAALILCYLIGA